MTGVLTEDSSMAGPSIRPDDVHTVLAQSILTDGFDFVLDLERSRGSYLVDARNGRR